MEGGKCMKSPIVSICCITYNHAPFIRKALDGFLMQEPPTDVSKDEPWYEILIHDDCSTDGTTEIIKEYAAKYPDRIFPLYEAENQYKKVGTVGIDYFNYNRARGRYIAYCEGDDYWIDPYKLQKQVDFMDANPEYSVCFHRAKHYNVNTGKYIDDACGYLLGDKEAVDITRDDFFERWYTQPLTMLFRMSMFDKSLRYQYKYYRDMHEIVHLLSMGKGRLMAFDGGVYNMHEGGIHSLVTLNEQFQLSYDLATEWYRKNPDKYIKKYYVKTLQWLLYRQAHIEGASRAYLIWKHFLLTGNVKRLVKNSLGKYTFERR